MEVNWFWTIIIGGLLSIPFSIVGNLLTPYSQKWLNKRSELSRSKSLKRLAEEYKRAKRYKDQPELIQLDFSENITKGIIAILTLIGGGSTFVLTVVAFSLFPFPFDEKIKSNILLFGILAAILAVFFPSSNSAISLLEFLLDYSHYKKFEEYEKRILAEMSVLEKKS
jgi:hypothetical protein